LQRLIISHPCQWDGTYDDLLMALRHACNFSNNLYRT
jgi:hypothetical protein